MITLPVVIAIIVTMTFVGAITALTSTNARSTTTGVLLLIIAAALALGAPTPTVEETRKVDNNTSICVKVTENTIIKRYTSDEFLCEPAFVKKK